MKCRIIISKDSENEVVIYAREETALTEKIRQFVEDCDSELTGYKDKTAVVLSLNDICCFTVESNKVYALTMSDKFRLKLRLYQLEDMVKDSFVKLNQSCIGNISMIERFEASVSGSLTVRFKNGYTDYVSRRQVKTVKERLGF